MRKYGEHCKEYKPAMSKMHKKRPAFSMPENGTGTNNDVDKC